MARGNIRLIFVTAFLFMILCTMHLSGETEPDGIYACVVKGPMIEKTVYYGETQARDTINIHAPEMKGENFLTVMDVLDDGTPVKKDDIVIRFDDSSFQKELETAQNEYELAQADLEKGKFELKNRMIDLDLDIQRKNLELEKAKVMVVENSIVISKVDLEKSKLAVQYAELELNQAKNARKDYEKEYAVTLEMKQLELKEAEKKIQTQKEKIRKAVVRAPSNGVVFKPFVKLNNEMGKVEKSKVVSLGDKLLELPNLDHFQGIVYINPSDNKFIKASDPVSIFLTALPEKEFHGIVSSKDPYPMTRNERLGKNDHEGTLEENKVVIDIEGRDPVLRPGMTFRAQIDSIIASECLNIPRIAVKHDDTDGDYVMVKKAGFAPEKRPIKTGRTGISFIEAVSGLASGEQVRLDFPETAEE